MDEKYKMTRSYGSMKKKTCDNCKYMETSFKDYPCNNCNRVAHPELEDHWKAIEVKK